MLKTQPGMEAAILKKLKQPGLQPDNKAWLSNSCALIDAKESVFELEMIFLLIFSLSSQKFEPDIAKRWMKMEDTQ